jgi:RNA polymerase sigma factor (sigma-70 family)
MRAAGPRCDVQEASRLRHGNPVPHPARHDERLAGGDLDVTRAVRQLETYLDAPGDEVEHFVGVGVQLAAMRRVTQDLRRTDRVAVDARWWALSVALDQHGVASGPLEPDDVPAEVQWDAGGDRGGCVHTSSSPQVAPGSREPVRRFGEEVGVEPSDVDVVAASLGDPAAFGLLFDRYARVVLQFLLRRVDPGDADALLGEVFRIAFQRREAFDLTRDSARPWLYGIASNLVAKHHRSAARRLRATASVAAQRATDSTDPADLAISSMENARMFERVVDAVGSLPHADREVLLLYAWEQLSYEEIAATLDLPVGTVRSRLHRARQRLRELTAEPKDEMR